mgnify:CR=1 FL=1
MARNDSTPEQQSVRVLKVGERVRHILSELLARGEAHDDVLSASNIAVTEVRMTPDLRNAKAYVKPLLGEDEGLGPPEAPEGRVAPEVRAHHVFAEGIREQRSFTVLKWCSIPEVGGGKAVVFTSSGA